MTPISPPPRLILASRSPRRRQLLAEAGYAFDVMPPADENEPGACSGESPERYAARLAEAKAADTAAQLAAVPRDASEVIVACDVILACDTVAECQGQILGKPADEHHARRMLQLLSGREHRVISGLCLCPLATGRPRTAVDITRLRMDRLSEAQIEEYLASGLWEGKAGAFGYQDRHGWLHVVSGSESNVVGLPLELLARMLGELTTT